MRSGKHIVVPVCGKSTIKIKARVRASFSTTVLDLIGVSRLCDLTVVFSNETRKIEDELVFRVHVNQCDVTHAPRSSQCVRHTHLVDAAYVTNNQLKEIETQSVIKFAKCKVSRFKT